MTLALEEWVHRISDEDQKRLAHALRFDSHPREFTELMAELRQRYDFIPTEVEPDGR
jgi:hypothetical protein